MRSSTSGERLLPSYTRSGLSKVFRSSKYSNSLRVHVAMKSTAAITVFAIFSLGCRFSGSEEVRESFPRVVTSLGTIEGYYKTSLNGRRYEAYEGIPYAQPPIGELRFEIPRRVSEWTGVLMAKEFGPHCLQYNWQEPDPTKIIQGSEDCLYLNIYTPIRSDGNASRLEEIGPRSSNLLPVIFYVHGGVFTFGSGSTYGELYLLDKNVTLVTMNYRVGPLGFLSTEDDIVPGNMGLKDLVTALHWVKDNIQSFGGDPSKVTIFGHSSGAAVVHYLYLTNLTTGLFHAGMSLSGVALSCCAQTKNSLGNTKRLADIVGCPVDTVQRMVDCLKGRPSHQIVRAMENFMALNKTATIPFGPMVEKGGGEFTFIDRSPIEIINSGRAQDVPWITGVVSEEGLFPMAYYVADKEMVNKLNNDWELMAPEILIFNYTIPQNDIPNVARLIKKHYLGTSPFGRSTINQTIRMVSDRHYVYAAAESVRLQARANKSPVRFYYFSYRGVTSESNYMSGTSENLGVSHEDDLLYVMKASFAELITTQQDRDVQKKLIDLWVSFATDGTPNTGVEWPEVSRSTEDQFRYLHIAGANDISVKLTPPNFGEKNFWNSLGFQENILYVNDTIL